MNSFLEPVQNLFLDAMIRSYALLVRTKYLSELSREKFESVGPLLESRRKNTRPRTMDLYEAFAHGALIVLRTGCQ